MPSPRRTVVIPASALTPLDETRVVRKDGVVANVLVAREGREMVVLHQTRTDRRKAWKEARRSAKALGQPPPEWMPQVTLAQMGLRLRREDEVPDGVSLIVPDDDPKELDGDTVTPHRSFLREAMAALDKRVSRRLTGRGGDR